jgi:hypothetical protein
MPRATLARLTNRKGVGCEPDHTTRDLPALTCAARGAKACCESSPEVQIRVVLHLIKLSVGTRDLADLRDWQSMRAVDTPPLRHQTRMTPKRRDELLAGGSIYWVISGFIQARQRLLDIRAEAWDDGTACAGLVLDPTLVPVAGRPCKPFQGWRYLDPAAAPPDLAQTPAQGLDALPEKMARELRALCLI